MIKFRLYKAEWLVINCNEFIDNWDVHTAMQGPSLVNVNCNEMKWSVVVSIDPRLVVGIRHKLVVSIFPGLGACIDRRLGASLNSSLGTTFEAHRFFLTKSYFPLWSPHLWHLLLYKRADMSDPRLGTCIENCRFLCQNVFVVFPCQSHFLWIVIFVGRNNPWKMSK